MIGLDFAGAQKINKRNTHAPGKRCGLASGFDNRHSVTLNHQHINIRGE